MTWRVRDEPSKSGKPSLEVIRAVAQETAEEVDGLVTTKQIETGLLPLKRRTTKARLKWYPD